ncbi:MAG: hypothetical protein PF495_03525, partial [Spirochaetales bacterium]|nr:hypothetical protein [Spirochaetales bacterium]
IKGFTYRILPGWAVAVGSASFFWLILKTCFNQYLFQNYSNLTSAFEFIKHPFLDTGIHMNTLKM